MRRKGGFQFIIGFVLGAVMFGGSVAFAAGIMAQPKTATVVIDNKVVDLKGYIIEGNHYFQLRDLDAALVPGGKDFSVVWDGTGNRVLIDTTRSYDPNEQYKPVNGSVTTTAADGSGKVSTQKLADKTIDGKELSREDFSQQANQSIFHGIYTRGAYNALRQSIVDRNKILPGNDSEGFNPYYAYANFVDTAYVPGENELDTTMALIDFTLQGGMSSYYVYTAGVEPYVKEYYKYPGYGIVKAYKNDFLAKANAATDSLIQEVSTLSDREKVVRFANLICDKMTYGNSNSGRGPNEVFTADTPVKGLCGAYAGAFLYLCQRSNIPCLTVSDVDHAWNVVYVDGKWQIVDVTNFSTARSMTWIFASNYPKQDENPNDTMFMQEALVPGSTQ